MPYGSLPLTPCPDRGSSRGEGDLIELARTGHRPAIEALLARHEPRVRRICERMTRCPEDARDLQQESMIALMRGLTGFRGDSAFMTWAYAVVRSNASRQRRRQRSRARVEEAVRDALACAPSPAADPESAIDRSRTCSAFTGALDGLTEVDRRVLLARDLEGMTAPEVARDLGLTVAAVKSRLHRARQHVRASLGTRTRAATANSPRGR